MSFTIYPKNTDIFLCKGVPFDIDYAYTVYFHNSVEQLNIISSYVHKQFNDQSYQRAGNGTLRIAVLADEIYDCNYLYFRNVSHGNKYFFCFIKGVTYINDRTTEVEYVIDSLQTYWFDFIMPPCFVEREHTLSDKIGDNIEPENIELGDYVVSQYEERVAPNVFNGGWYVMIKYLINRNPDEGQHVRFLKYYETDNNPYNWQTSPDDIYGASIYNNVNEAYTTIVFPCTVAGMDVTEVISRAIIKLQRLGAVPIDICMIPPEVGSDYSLTTDYAYSVNTPAPHSWVFTQERGFSYATIANSSYIPKNNKLYTAPFSKLVVTNNQGESTEYRWEMFTRTSYAFDPQARFSVYNILYPDVAQHCVPYNYNGKVDESYEHGIIVTNFPKSAWSEDTYTQWEHTNGLQWSLSMVSAVLSSAFTIGKTAVVGYGASKALDMAGNSLLNSGNSSAALKAFQGAERTRWGTDYSVAKSGTSSLMNIFDLIAQKSAVRATPDTLKGNSNTSGVLSREFRYGFSAYGMTVCGEMAETIDNYFSIFGYAINKIKQPNIMQANVLSVRPEWNYVKTRNCIIIPNNSQSSTYGMNAQVVKAIQGIFDNGITFWMNHTHVGRYNLSNNPPN